MINSKSKIFIAGHNGLIGSTLYNLLKTINNIDKIIKLIVKDNIRSLKNNSFDCLLNP